MAYFGALLTRADQQWEAHDVDVDELEDLDNLVELMRGEPADDGTALLVIEQEDTWFALVRLDGEDEPRVFVSDVAAATRSAYGEVLLVSELPLVAPVSEAADHDPGEADEDDDAVFDEGLVAEAGPAGDAGLLSDFGLPAERLVDLCDDATLPAEALAEVAVVIGAGDELEAVR